MLELSGSSLMSCRVVASAIDNSIIAAHAGPRCFRLLQIVPMGHCSAVVDQKEELHGDPAEPIEIPKVARLPPSRAEPCQGGGRLQAATSRRDQRRPSI
ncbi:MAG TPA: hypothetical protein DIU15_05845 [Deltaproteobacteria bacterium]|nr:hypothetical protein [Deltaproteobacteria bacterium]HCP45541.1 hypothetical protein [Deltaproteobacteria bacterium]